MTGRSLIEGEPLPAKKRRVLMLILDGWGYQAPSATNLISQAKTPVMDRLPELSFYHAEGVRRGRRPSGGTVGNSEVGHLHIGAGRRIYSDRVRIDRAIADGSFFTNEAFLHPIRHAKDIGVPLHLMGIVSFFSSHGSVNHLLALMEIAKREGVRDVFIHAMLGEGENSRRAAPTISRSSRKRRPKSEWEKWCR